jgi:hypothetical protein
MYPRHRRHLEIIWSLTTGTGSWWSCSDVKGWTRRAKGSFDFLRVEYVCGMQFNVDRTYLGGQLAYGEGVAAVCHHVSLGYAGLVEK